MTPSEQTMEHAVLLERLREKLPELYRHLIGLIRSLLK
jgi:hypothetical protein